MAYPASARVECCSAAMNARPADRAACGACAKQARSDDGSAHDVAGPERSFVLRATGMVAVGGRVPGS